MNLNDIFNLKLLWNDTVFTNFEMKISKNTGLIVEKSRFFEIWLKS